MTLRWVFAHFALCSIVVSADRDSHKIGPKSSIHLTRDGHFQLAEVARHSDSSAPAAEVATAEPRKIRALSDLESRALVPMVMKNTRPAGSFVNRTDDWMTLSQVAAGSLASTRLQTVVMNTPAPTVPPNRYEKKPSSWPATGWSAYKRAEAALKPLRGGAGNGVATVAAVFLGPDSCILKILYVFFSMDGEDDYPYIPRGCGNMFDFALNANSIPVPWMLIVGALFIITGTHSSANSLQ